MRGPGDISQEEMMGIYTQIEACSHLGETDPQRNIIQTAKTAWLRRMRESERNTNKPKVKWVLTRNDVKLFLNKLGILVDDLTENTPTKNSPPKAMALVRINRPQKIELTTNDKRFLKSLGISAEDFNPSSRSPLGENYLD